jgi:hypothetical protein
MPRCLAGIIRSVKRADLQRQLLDEVEGAVRELAQKHKAYVRVHRPFELPYEILPADLRRDYLHQVEVRPGFVQSLRRKAQHARREANVLKRLFPSDGIAFNEKLPDSGEFLVEGTTRLNSIEAVFETLNVGFVGALVNYINQRTSAPLSSEFGFDDRENVSRVLAWHCGLAGLLSAILDYQKPLGRRYGVTEVDVFGDMRDRENLTWWSGSHGVDASGDKISPVVERRYDVPQAGRYHFVVLDMPCPSDRQGRHLRDNFKSDHERLVRDPGRLGLSAWRKELASYVARLPSLLADDGEALLILPKAIREGRGYRLAEDLTEDTEGLVRAEGLEIVRDLVIHERRPLAQPFVHTSRPIRRLLIVRRRAR